MNGLGTKHKKVSEIIITSISHTYVHSRSLLRNVPFMKTTAAKERVSEKQD